MTKEKQGRSTMQLAAPDPWRHFAHERGTLVEGCRACRCRLRFGAISDVTSPQGAAMISSKGYSLYFEGSEGGRPRAALGKRCDTNLKV